MEPKPPLSPISQLSHSIGAREITPRQVVRTVLDRIRQRDGQLQAWAHVCWDEAEQAAIEAGREITAGQRRGPLHGIPFGVKDIFDTAGVPTAWGSPLYADRVPGEDSELVASLKRAGAILIGKTHTTAFAYFDPGPTRNPHNPDYTPGGSSSGSAAAVADGMVPFALGSQTLGSVLRPASFCGVVGLKPTFGTLPTGGVLPFAPTLDHAGLFTRTVEEMAWLWAAVANEPQAVASTQLRLGRPPWPLVGELEPEMARQFDQAVARLARAGFEIESVDLPDCLSRLPDATMTVNRYEGAHTHKDRFQQYGNGIGEKLAVLVEKGLSIGNAEYQQALELLAEARCDFSESAKKHPVWITPSALGPAPHGLGSTGDPRANYPFTALGVPAISLPFGRDSKGLPLGLQLGAARGQESALLATALACEQLLK